MKTRLRMFTALPHQARVPVRDYDADRNRARQWMNRKGIFDVRRVYEAPPEPPELDDDKVVSLIDRIQL